ncbi:MAG: efflux RND transporter periplasmic adaptor subunit [Planctomycetes bacterium]|nr:efflux RND transporter periplasmic adaptor subunit [Planctomycetota bacterium]
MENETAAKEQNPFTSEVDIQNLTREEPKKDFLKFSKYETGVYSIVVIVAMASTFILGAIFHEDIGKLPAFLNFGPDQEDAGAGGMNRRRSGGEETVIPVRTAILKTGSITENYEASGNVTCYEMVDVLAKVGGIIKDVFVQEGQFVREGDQLLAIVDDELRLRKTRAEIAVMEAEHRLNQSKLERDRVQREYDDKVRVSTNSPDIVSHTDLESLRVASERAVIDVQAAELTHRQREADLEEANLNLGYAVVKTTISGIVTRRIVQKGQLIGANTATVTVLNPLALEILLPVPDRVIRKGSLRKGDSVYVTNAANPVPGEVFDGVIEAVASYVDERTGTQLLRIRFPALERMISGVHKMLEAMNWEANKINDFPISEFAYEFIQAVRNPASEFALKPGDEVSLMVETLMKAQNASEFGLNGGSAKPEYVEEIFGAGKGCYDLISRLLPGTYSAISIVMDEESGLLVPKTAISYENRESVIYLVREGKADRITISNYINLANKEYVQVKTGLLNEGEKVIIEGQSSLRQGTPVKDVDEPASAAANAAGGATEGQGRAGSQGGAGGSQAGGQRGSRGSQ